MTTISRNIFISGSFVLAFAGVATAGEGISLQIERLGPRIECVTFPSRILDHEMSFCVILPENYTHDRDDWPVLFLLHGRGRTHRSLIDDKAARRHLLKADFVVVLPQGDDGWYIDSPVNKEDRYSSYLAEVIDVAGRRYGLSDHPQDRGLCGWSMGGYGCVRYAVAHAGEFGVVAPIIGLLDFPRDGLPEGQDYPVPIETFGSNPDLWTRFNPLNEADKLQGSSILLITADQAFDRTMNEHFHNRLTRLKIPHEWIVLDGGHTFDVVRTALPLVIEHANRSFR